jgi:hypothetical protein
MAETTEMKWRPAENLGPRQAKAFNEALSAFGWEAKTTGEITDFSQGQPSYSTLMFGGAWSPMARELMDAIRTKYDPLLVTPENYKAIVADLQAAIAKHAESGRPVVDRRSTDQERAERDRARQEREEKERVRAAHLATLTKHTYDLPETAKAAKRVLLTLWPNTVFSVKSKSYSMGYSIHASWTDGPTERDVKPVLDVFSNKHFDGMQDLETTLPPGEWNGHLWNFQGGYTSGSRRHSFEFLQSCAQRFSVVTKLPMPTIRQDGSHPFLERDGSGPCGWSFSFYESQTEEYPNGVIARNECSNDTAADVVGQMAHRTSMEQAAFPLGRHGYDEEWDTTQNTVYKILLGEIGTPPPPEPAATCTQVDGITVSENIAKDGVEVRFPDKPAAEVLERLKSAGWHWSRFSKCWYHKGRTPAALAFANQLAGKTDLLTSTDHGLAAMTDVDAQYERQCEDATMR